MRGRKPVPTKLKVLRGNPGKRAINRKEPKPTPRTPGCPTWLSLEAKAEWRRQVAELERTRVLTLEDRAELAVYCACWSMFVEAYRDVQANGHTLLAHETTAIDGTVIFVKPVKNPAVQTVRDMAEKVRQYGAEFGFSPSARTRLHTPEAEDDDGVASLFS